MSSLLSFFFFYCSGHLRDLHSFPTRRSSDLLLSVGLLIFFYRVFAVYTVRSGECRPKPVDPSTRILTRTEKGQLVSYPDRKSTRLNSSHRCISYAVFCLKKKKNTKKYQTTTS